MSNYTRNQQTFPQARLSIFISGHPVLQGKIYQREGKWIYLANIDGNKLWHKFNGYSIALQILETFSKAKIKPLILYKYAERNLVFQTNISTFKKKGIPILAGSHRQLILTIPEWKYFKDDLNEPYNLPNMSVDNWLKPPVKMLHIDPEQKLNSMFKLKEIWEAKYK